jgi:hypothetical protein
MTMRYLSDIPATDLPALAQALAAGGAIAGCTTAERVISALYYGDGLGLSVGQSCRMVQCVLQRYTLTADGVGALVRSHPACEVLTVREWSADRCVVYSRRADGAEHTATASLDDARRRGLARKGSPWETSPARMLQITAMRELQRVLYPDIAGDGGAQPEPTPEEHATADAEAQAAPPTPLERAQQQAPAAEAPPVRTLRDVLTEATADPDYSGWRAGLTVEDQQAMRELLRGLDGDDLAGLIAAERPGRAVRLLATAAGIGPDASIPDAPAGVPHDRRAARNVAKHLAALDLLTAEQVTALARPGVLPESITLTTTDDAADAATLLALIPPAATTE